MATEGTREGGSSMNKGQGRYFDRRRNRVEEQDFQDRIDSLTGIGRQTERDHLAEISRMGTDRRAMNVRTETTEELLSFRKKTRMKKTKEEEVNHPAQKKTNQAW